MIVLESKLIQLINKDGEILGQIISDFKIVSSIIFYSGNVDPEGENF